MMSSVPPTTMTINHTKAATSGSETDSNTAKIMNAYKFLDMMSRLMPRVGLEDVIHQPIHCPLIFSALNEKMSHHHHNNINNTSSDVVKPIPLPSPVKALVSMWFFEIVLFVLFVQRKNVVKR